MQLGLLRGEPVHIDDEIGDVLAESLQTQFVVAIDIRLAEFDETAERGEAFQALRR